MENESYSGMFEDGKRHGEGRLLQSNEDIYEGNFAYGMREGRGRLI